MNENELIEEFYTDLQQAVIAEADTAEDGQLRSEAFTEWVIHELTELGEIEGGNQCFIKKRGIEASGYYLSDESSCLEIFTTRARLVGTRYTLGTNDAETLLKRAKNFVVESVNGLYEKIEEASEAFDMSLAICKSWRHIDSVRIHLFTDGDTRITELDTDEIDGREVTCMVWDLTRLYRNTAMEAQGTKLQVNLNDVCGEPLRMFKVAEQSDQYDCYIGAVNGRTLMNLYGKFGPRLLERNVRTFLQARGKVNKGIRSSLKSEPEMFVAYNNGLSATCTGCTYEELGNDVVLISDIEELQIVNGGQTTGSLFNAWKKDRIDIDQVWVQVKITEILDPVEVDVIAPRISEYSNTQNRVTTADFSSNDPYHIELEKLSRKMWAPAVNDSQRQTRWFYERSRGQYMDQLARAETPARKLRFKAENPTRQKFVKTDAAKYENTWAQLPHLVSRGAQKNFAEFMQRREETQARLPDEEAFRRLVAKAILFKDTDRIVRLQNFGGYKANIVTYTLALICFRTAQRINLEEIWRAQQVPDALRETVKLVASEVFRVISNPPDNQNVTEYCKKEVCWKAVKEIRFELSGAFTGQLLDTETAARNPESSESAVVSPSEQELITEMGKISADEWFAISKWAKITQNLKPWQRSIAVSLGRLGGNERACSFKQARQGKILRDEAIELGFVLEGGEDDAA